MRPTTWMRLCMCGMFASILLGMVSSIVHGTFAWAGIAAALCFTASAIGWMAEVAAHTAPTMMKWKYELTINRT